MSDKLDKIKEKIRRLSEMTVENGCSENEALTATEKMGRLLDEHQLSMSDIELKKQDCQQKEVWTGMTIRDHMQGCIGGIAFYSDTKPWMSTGGRTGMKYVYFGLPDDIELAHYTHCNINRAILEESENYKLSDEYAYYPGARKRKALRAFKYGMAERIGTRLREIKKARQEWMKSQGRDLIVLKDQLVKSSFQTLGMRLRTTTGPRVTDRYGYGQGQVAGNNFNLNEGLKGSASRKGISGYQTK